MIAIALKHMLAAGIPHDQIIEAVTEMESAFLRNSAETADPPFSDKERSPTPPKEINSNPRETKRARGSRLSPEWAPSPENITYATSQGLVGEVMAREVEKFRDYWTAKAGQSAVKLDWDATWRNWIRNARPARATPHEPRKTAHQLHQEACDRELNKVIFGNDYHDERSDNIIDLAAADYRYR